MKLFIIYQILIYLIFTVDLINSQGNFKVIEIFTPGVSIPENLYTMEAFDTAEKLFAMNNRKEETTLLNKKSKENNLDEDTSYDILGNKWSSKDIMLLTEKGFLQGTFSGKVLKEFYTDLLKLSENFNFDEFSLFTPICFKENYSSNNAFKVTKDFNSKLNINNLIKPKNFIENCNKKYQQTMYSKLLGFYPNLGSPKFINEEIDIKAFNNLNLSIRNKQHIVTDINNSIKKDEISSIETPVIPIRGISSKNYASAYLKRYNNCTTAIRVYDDAVKNNNFNDLAKEFDKKFKNKLKDSLINLHNIIQSYFNSIESSFSSIVEICDSLITSIESQNTSGFKSDIFTKDIQKEIFIECKNIFKKHYFHAMFIDKHQIQLIVRDFYEDLANNLDSELLSSSKDPYSYTFDTISSFKFEHSKESNTPNSNALNSDSKKRNGLFKDNVITNKNKADLINNQEAFYNKLNTNFLKKYAIIVQEPMFQAAAMSFLKDVFETKNYLPSYGSSLIFELKFDSKIKSVTIYYNNNTLIQESFFNFSKKIREYLISENDILIWCGLKTNLNKIYDITMYASFSLFLILGALIVIMYFCCDDAGETKDKLEIKKLIDEENNSSQDLGGSDRPILTEEDLKDKDNQDNVKREKEELKNNNNQNEL
jgi:hypothetical protein